MGRQQICIELLWGSTQALGKTRKWEDIIKVSKTRINLSYVFVCLCIYICRV